MQSLLRNSGSKTFSAITTLPSATDTTELGPPARKRRGTRKKAVCQATISRIRANSGQNTQEWTNRTSNAAKAPPIRYTSATLP